MWTFRSATITSSLCARSWRLDSAGSWLAGTRRLSFIYKNRYTQYRNVGYFNHTNMRNALIQRMTLHASHQFTPLLIKHFEERGFFLFLQPDPTRFKYAVEKSLPQPALQPHPHWGRPDQPWLSSEANPDPPYEDVYDPTNDLPENQGVILFDIVMPTYNRANLLIRAIRSVMSQQHKRWRLWIVGDNCPTLEKTMRSIELELDDRVRWFNLQYNRGAGGAVPRNYALNNLIESDWVAYLDDDNAWYLQHTSHILIF